MRPLSSRRPITGLTRTRHVDNTFFFRYSPRSQIFQEMDFNHFAKCQIPIFSYLKFFKVKSQIKSLVFQKNKYVNRFSIESQDGDI